MTRKAAIVPGDAKLPEGYTDLVKELKTKIRSAQVKAALSVNRELICLYWQIGRDLVEKQDAEGWGAKVIDRLARDLQSEFPGTDGFSRTNLYRMRAFYSAYPHTSPVVPQVVGQTDCLLPEPVMHIPWGHNVILIAKVKDQTERE